MQRSILSSSPGMFLRCHSQPSKLSNSISPNPLLARYRRMSGLFSSESVHGFPNPASDHNSFNMTNHAPVSNRYIIAVLPGDGIGPEVVAQGVKVLRAVERQLDGVRFELQEYSVGAGEYLKNGDPLPPATLERCRQC